MIFHASGLMPNLNAVARVTRDGALLEVMSLDSCLRRSDSDLFVLGAPDAIFDDEVTKQQGRLLHHDAPDPVEHETNLLFRPGIGACLDRVPQGTDVGGP